jgi:hypothetical protein
MAESPSAGAGSDGKPQTSSSQKLKKSELRRHIRFVPEKATAQLYPKKFLTTIGIGRDKEARQIVNLSESGALIILGSKLTSGTRVQVRIEMEQYKDVIETEGEIRWCYQSARNKAEFYAGIQFHNLPRLAATRIGKMREWFTSPEYKLKSSTKRRLQGPLEKDSPLKYEE